MRISTYIMFPGTVPDKTLEVPEQLLDLKFGNTKIYINGTYDADQVKLNTNCPISLYPFYIVGMI